MREGRSVASLSASYRELEGRHVVITGGASGIGLCMVESFLGQAAHVTVIDHDEHALRSCAERFGDGRATFRCADLSSIAVASTTIRDCAAVAPIDVLIANAANDTRHSWNGVTEESWRNVLAVNLDHQFFCAQAAAGDMVGRGRPGVIILMGSVAARRGRPAMIGYLTAKAAIDGMVRGLARELGQKRIRVAGLVPGAIETERQRRLWRTPASEQYLLTEQAMPVLLDGWDIAAMTLFLASDGARGCTGQIYVVDAGLS
ncbi:SDR family NAD(P)-dependent oxidoreductase [Bosea vaviloviae]|uniref:3-oxoacyl-ACP reductase n=1 Tax=Bosea vaviloviae TaxID=1526658 RepID=A0A0N1EYX6_9HYPH|nr:SDR family oxidoreductase [Bosea vaviloviae]KPH74447.1 hypothetical protein AE618_25755 [Bosea vaviloviae]